MRTIARIAATALLTASAFAQQPWILLGPFGGSVRSLAHDPRNPDHIFLGTSAGQLYRSSDGGQSWTRWAQFGDGDHVLDNILVDPRHAEIIYVAAWRLEGGGDLFRSRDGGTSWEAVPALQGKSIRALALAPSDSRLLVAGALEGVFRSTDGGDHWERISPPGDTGPRNVESLAIDPWHPEVIYAGTWHLPWKTADGGRTWHAISTGLVNDSDIFSIAVDRDHPTVLYLSACTGIYRSTNAGERFRKLQGIPESARRTRSLRPDPANRDTIYAGTTAGLWKTTNGGRRWQRLTAADVVVNDILLDPRRPSRVLLAVEGRGVLASNDGGRSFAASNHGFAHRQVTSVVVDRDSPRTIYAAVAQDHDSGLFVSRDAGAHWTNMRPGLGPHNVFALRQAADGALVVGTAAGIFALPRNAAAWVPHPLPGAAQRVTQLELFPDRWLAATSAGLFISRDEGRSWRGGPLLDEGDLIALAAAETTVLAASSRAAMFSRDRGETWTRAILPASLTAISGVAVGPESALWLATPQGAYVSRDDGRSWEHVLVSLPARNLTTIAFDVESRRLLGTSSSGEIFASADGGHTWTRSAHTGWPIRSLIVTRGRLLAATRFDGIVAQTDAATDLGESTRSAKP